MTATVRPILKARTEVLVKDIGVEAACAAIGKSKATIGRYYSTHDEHRDRFMPIDSVALLEREASRPFVTATLADLAGLGVGDVPGRPTALARRLEAVLDADGTLPADRARYLLAEADALSAALDAARRRIAEQASGGLGSRRA